MGLLSKAANVSTQKSMTFAEFIFLNKIETCALFKKDDQFFYIENSIGFDGLSLISSKSTVDFWEGICSERWIVKSFSKNDGSISPLLQFFSFYMSEKIETASILRISDDLIFILLNAEILPLYKSQLANLSNSDHVIHFEKLNAFINKNTKCISCKINFNEAIESFLKMNLKASSYKENENIFKKVLFNELSNRILFFTHLDACKKNLSIQNSLEVLTVFTAASNTPFSLIMIQIIMLLKNVLMECAELTEFSDSKECKTFLELKNFLEEM